MKKVYHLSSCSTCQRILKELDLSARGFELIDIKTQGIEEMDLDYMASKEGSYEALFSRRAMKFRGMGLHEQILSESDFKRLILSEYTFLKRPVILFEDQVFVGNSKKVISEAASFIS